MIAFLKLSPVLLLAGLMMLSSAGILGLDILVTEIDSCLEEE